MRLVYHSTSRNIFNWGHGTHTLEITYRGTKEELIQKLKEELEKELSKNA